MRGDTPIAGDERIHLVTIAWARGKWSGVLGNDSREHLWQFAGKLRLKVTDALAPMAYRDTVRLDPLKSYVVTVASAHMLAWLHAAFSHGCADRSNARTRSRRAASATSRASNASIAVASSPSQRWKSRPSARHRPMRDCP